MGSLISRLMNTLYLRKMDVVIVGLASAGKSTLLGVISEGTAVPETSPTIAMNVKIVKKGSVQMKMWDLGYVVDCGRLLFWILSSTLLSDCLTKLTDTFP